MSSNEKNTTHGCSKTSLEKSLGCSPVTTGDSHFDVDTAAVERKLVRKCDLHVLPVLFVMYTFAFLDRINIGNAKIQGLMKDLNMTGQQYNLALLIFFIPYIILEVPSNLMLRKVTPSTWLSGLAFCWGIISMCQGFVTTHAGLVACRFLLGVFESGAFPGSVYLISSYYKRHELQKRWTFFFSSGLFAGAFGGLLAFALAKMNGLGGYSGWRWIFIIEGVATVVFSFVAKLTIVDWPEDAKFLNPSEKTLLIRRLAGDGASGVARMDRLDRSAVIRILRDWKIWICAVIYMSVATASYSTIFFIPSILNEMGYSASQAQLHTIPVYGVCIVVAYMTSYLSDRLRHRYAFTMVGILICTIGYSMLLRQNGLDTQAKYLAIFFVTSGLYMMQPITIVWLANNLRGHYKCAFGSAIQIAIGNLGGIIGSNIFLQSEIPTYRTGYSVSLGAMWFSGVLCTLFYLGLMRENRKRTRGDRDWRLRGPADEVENLGDDHPDFRFTG
ncbi:MFS transporter [Bisporella sp. PMI_857]|nr:MFS transporter [Bisporella sp. PMI_857]